MGEKEYLSREKYDELKKELQLLRSEKRQEVAERLEYARSLGDLSENAEYHAARDEQAEIESRIRQLNDLFKRAEIIEHSKGDIVSVGSIVVIQKKGSQDKNTYEIVGSEEVDLTSGKLSYKSPIGSAMIGKKKKEEFSFETPKGMVKYTILEIK